MTVSRNMFGMQIVGETSEVDQEKKFLTYYYRYSTPGKNTNSSIRIIIKFCEMFVDKLDRRRSDLIYFSNDNTKTIFFFPVCHSGWESEESIRRFDHQDIKEGVKIPDEDFFEGAEKLLEVSWAPRGDLRCLPRTTIEEILRLAR